MLLPCLRCLSKMVTTTITQNTYKNFERGANTVAVANLPAEIAHLLEEIEAKDKIAHECRQVIHTRDSSIQKFIKANGHSQVNPKEDAYVKTVFANYDKAQSLQEEKVALSDKARILVRSSHPPRPRR